MRIWFIYCKGPHKRQSSLFPLNDSYIYSGGWQSWILRELLVMSNLNLSCFRILWQHNITFMKFGLIWKNPFDLITRTIFAKKKVLYREWCKLEAHFRRLLNVPLDLFLWKNSMQQYLLICYSTTEPCIMPGIQKNNWIQSLPSNNSEMRGSHGGSHL